MSRIGKLPVHLPAGVTVTFENGLLTVKGAKGTLTQQVVGEIDIKVEGAEAHVIKKVDSKELEAKHGLYRALLHNMVVGVSQGFQKELEINGVGYRAQLSGTDLVMNLGYSHQVTMAAAPGITIEVPAPTRIIIKGADKQAVGQFAAVVRGKRPPEPYKGKGIRYAGEVIIRKEGQAGKK